MKIINIASVRLDEIHIMNKNQEYMLSCHEAAVKI